TGAEEETEDKDIEGELLGSQIKDRLVKRFRRRAADRLAGKLLRKMAEAKASRILVSTRLFPADLEDEFGHTIPGSKLIRLPGLEGKLPGTDQTEAHLLWEALGLSGSPNALTDFFERVGYHPLAIKTLGAEISQYKPAQKSYDNWVKKKGGLDL